MRILVDIVVAHSKLFDDKVICNNYDFSFTLKLEAFNLTRSKVPVGKWRNIIDSANTFDDLMLDTFDFNVRYYQDYR